MKKQLQEWVGGRNYLAKQNVRHIFWSDWISLVGMSILGCYIGSCIWLNVSIAWVLAGSIVFAILFLCVESYAIHYDFRSLRSAVEKDRSYRTFMQKMEDKPETEKKKLWLQVWAKCLNLKVNRWEKDALYGRWNHHPAVLAFDWSPKFRNNSKVVFLIQSDTKDFHTIKQNCAGSMIVLLTENDCYRLWPWREQGEQLYTKVDTQGWNKGGLCGIFLLALAILENHWGFFVAGVFCLIFYEANLWKNRRNNPIFTLKKAIHFAKKKV